MPQDKRQHNHAREEDEHPRRAEALQAPTDKYQKKEKQPSRQTPIAMTSIKAPLPTTAPRGKEHTTQGAGPPKQQNKRHPRMSRSPKTLKDRLQPQPATNTNRC